MKTWHYDVFVKKNNNNKQLNKIKTTTKKVKRARANLHNVT